MKEHRVKENLASLNLKVEALIKVCEDLHPQLELLLGIADEVDKSRRTLEADAKALYWICAKACQQQNGSILYYDGKWTIELRLRHRGFWTQQPFRPRVLKLRQDALDFPKFSRATDLPHRLDNMISTIGLPYDRAKQLAADLAESLDALRIENLVDVMPLVNRMTTKQTLRMNGSVLEVRNDLSRSDKWVEVLNLESFHPYVKQLANFREAISSRQ